MIVLLLLLVSLCSAAESAKSGPAIGAKIPDFEGTDQKGRRQTFASLRGPKGLVLMFVRSADWCPYCKAQLVDLNQHIEEYKKRGLNVASLTNDSVAILKNYSTRKGIRFPMLSDPDSQAIRAFGILNESAPKHTPFYGIPYPGTYIIDERGVVKSKYFEPDFRETYTAASILTHEFAADGKQKSAVETPHLKLSSAAADTALAPGGRTSLILDLDLKPSMHVYAPGVEGGYISIEWTMAESKAWSALPTQFPPSRKLRLEAIDETVPVYEGHVRLVRDLALDKSAAGGSDVSVEGTFRYQACDDHMCYIPKSIPLKWTFRVRPLDSERVPEELQRK